MHWNEKAINNLQEVLGQRDGDRMRVYIGKSVVRLRHSDRAFRRIAQAADRQAMFDDITAIRYGLAFEWLRFAVECEPLGDKGPDLAVSRDGETTSGN